MGNRIRCFWLEPSKLSEVSLRRYRMIKYLKDDAGNYVYEANGKTLKKDPNWYACKNSWGCDASVVIGQKDYEQDQGKIVDETMKADARWPKACEACGRAFEDADEWQWNERQLYTRSDNGELVTIRNAPVGAMWDAHWMAGLQGSRGTYKKGPDGYCVTVKTPDGDWCVDGPASNMGGWTRSGTVPDITAQPSILMEKYHGWLRNGWLEEC